jgi:acyl-CoA thioester hydrolase
MTTSVPAPLQEYPFVHWIDVRFRDLDSLGHVNNSVYATYFESTRIAYYQSLTGMPLEQLNIILAELTITYRAPAFFGDRLGVGIRVASFGTKSFVMEYNIIRERDAAQIAAARSVLVMYDYALDRTVPVSEEFRRIVAERQGE